MHPSESVRCAIIPVLFDGTGYRSWRCGVLRALFMKNKVGFINGKVQKPALNSPTFAQWERCDNIVTSWILNSLLKDFADSLQYVNNTKELWEELQDRYDETNGAKLYQLQQEINDLAQGNLDITGYYSMLRRLWEELNTLDPNTQCTCLYNYGGKTKMHKAEQDRKLIQFLMGLNEVYTIVRGSTLMLHPLPTMAQAFSILVQEDKQRVVKPSTRMNLDAISVKENFRKNYSQNKRTNNRGPSNHSQQDNRTYLFLDINKANLFCNYCKKTGHTEEKCYRQHGFPHNFKFTKGRNSGSAAIAHNNCEAPMDHAHGTQSLTKDQYDHLVRFLENI
ncbi:hypothetical protein EJD97_005079 [Solanum chilense]|uniref:Retrotransposon Copia-like N-terminal domain-containing protein n=1 Tax=Solanum chilense TaxID=4083 RepID=A0A6N2BT03_SOLCI|nr:hypothetical protein EJD97_005079 [Solanum chilense]